MCMHMAAGHKALAHVVHGRGANFGQVAFASRGVAMAPMAHVPPTLFFSYSFSFFLLSLKKKQKLKKNNIPLTI